MKNEACNVFVILANKEQYSIADIAHSALWHVRPHLKPDSIQTNSKLVVWKVIYLRKTFGQEKRKIEIFDYRIIVPIIFDMHENGKGCFISPPFAGPCIADDHNL